MEAPHLVGTDDHHDDLARVVARIRSRGRHASLPKPSAEAIAAVIAHLRDDEPLSATELAEDERLWRVVEDEARA
jgi:hypothetical protein